MPIRFTCPHCRQKLSVARRKAGSTAECPRCKRSLTIPQPPAETVHPKQAPLLDAASTSSNAPADATPPPIGEAAIFSPDADEFAGLELVYDTAPTVATPSPPPAVADVIVIPRYIVYLQGGLLAVVALIAFRDRHGNGQHVCRAAPSCCTTPSDHWQRQLLIRPSQQARRWRRRHPVAAHADPTCRKSSCRRPSAQRSSVRSRSQRRRHSPRNRRQLRAGRCQRPLPARSPEPRPIPAARHFARQAVRLRG